MHEFVILISTLLMVIASPLQIKTYESYYRSQIKNTDQIVFYFLGDTYFYLLPSAQLSHQQVTILDNLTTAVLQLQLLLNTIITELLNNNY